LQTLLKRRREEREKVIEMIRRAAEEARKNGPISVILFGSYARGDFNLWSDVDVIVVSERVRGVKPTKRWLLFPEFEDFEAIFWTPEEAKKTIKKPSRREALRHKIIIIDDFRMFDE